MKKSLALVILLLFVFEACAAALPFNERKLLYLHPLLSERIAARAETGRTNKLWPALASAALGAAVIAASQNQSNFASADDQRLNNLEFGWLFLTLGASIYLMKTTPEIDPKLLGDISQPGLEREKYAYLLYKNSESESRLSREHTGFIWTIWGMGVALLPLATPNASKEYRSTVTVAGLILAGLGLIQYTVPSEAEKEMKSIDAELAK